MPKFTKKPVTIEAVRWDGTNVKEVLDFMAWRNASHDDHEGLRIHTLEGTHQATPGDWIIKGVQGEFYPCKPDIFAATYSPAQSHGDPVTLRVEADTTQAKAYVEQQLEALESWKAQALAVQGAAEERLRPLLKDLPGVLGRNLFDVAADEIERLRRGLRSLILSHPNHFAAEVIEAKGMLVTPTKQ